MDALIVMNNNNNISNNNKNNNSNRGGGGGGGASARTSYDGGAILEEGQGADGQRVRLYHGVKRAQTCSHSRHVNVAHAAQHLLELAQAFAGHDFPHLVGGMWGERKGGGWGWGWGWGGIAL